MSRRAGDDANIPLSACKVSKQEGLKHVFLCSYVSGKLPNAALRPVSLRVFPLSHSHFSLESIVGWPRPAARCCSRRRRNGDVRRSRAGQVNAFCNVCVNSHLFLSFRSLFSLCDSLWALCHQLQMFSPTKLLTSICGQEKTEERGEEGGK